MTPNANIITPDDGNININSGENSPAADGIRVPESTDRSMLASRRSVRNPVANTTTEQPKDMWAELVEEVNNEQPQQSSPAVNQSDDRADWVKRMIALSKQKREEIDDGWRLCERVPPHQVIDALTNRTHATVNGVEWCKAPGGRYLHREGEEQPVPKQQQQTQPEATERTETHEDEQSQGQQVDTRKNSEKWHHSYSKTDAAVVALMDAEIHGALFETVVMIAKFSRKLSNGDWVFNLSGEQFGKRLGCNQKAASKRITDAVNAGFIEKIANHCAGRTGATYRLKF